MMDHVMKTLPTRSAILMGWHSPALARLIQTQIDNDEAEYELRVIAGPDLEDAAMEYAAELESEWISIGDGIEEQRGPIRAKRLVADKIMRGDWPMVVRPLTES